MPGILSTSTVSQERFPLMGASVCLLMSPRVLLASHAPKKPTRKRPQVGKSPTKDLSGQSLDWPEDFVLSSSVGFLFTMAGIGTEGWVGWGVFSFFLVWFFCFFLSRGCGGCIANVKTRVWRDFFFSRRP